MRMSESIDQIAGALAAAQGEYKPAVKNRQNPHFKNWYADLSSIFEATRPALSKYGLALAQFPEVIDGRVAIISKLLHKSGQWLEDTLSLKPAGDTPQAIGSAITYGKRYAAEAILGISGEDEDDGNAASDRDKHNQNQSGNTGKQQQIIGAIGNPKQAAPSAQTPSKRPFDRHNNAHVAWLLKKLEERNLAQGEDFKRSRDLIVEDFNGKDMQTDLDAHLDKVAHGEY